MWDIVAHPASNRMAKCIAPTDHKLAGSSVLHVLAHRGGAHTSSSWYAELARVVVDQVASTLSYVQFLAICLVVGWLVCVESFCANAVLTVRVASERVCVCGCVCGSGEYCVCSACCVWCLVVVSRRVSQCGATGCSPREPSQRQASHTSVPGGRGRQPGGLSVAAAERSGSLNNTQLYIIIRMHGQ